MTYGQNEPKDWIKEKIEKVRIGLKFLKWEGFCQSVELRSDPTNAFSRRRWGGISTADVHSPFPRSCSWEHLPTRSDSLLNELRIFPSKHVPFLMARSCQWSQYLCWESLSTSIPSWIFTPILNPSKLLTSHLSGTFECYYANFSPCDSSVDFDVSGLVSTFETSRHNKGRFIRKSQIFISLHPNPWNSLRLALCLQEINRKYILSFQILPRY